MAGEDPEHLRNLRAMACAACDKRAEDAHHPVGLAARWKGPGRSYGSKKAHDHLAIPMCHQCHMDFHGNCGRFKGWEKVDLLAWQNGMSERYMPKVPRDDVF